MTLTHLPAQGNFGQARQQTQRARVHGLLARGAMQESHGRTHLIFRVMWSIASRNLRTTRPAAFTSSSAPPRPPPPPRPPSDAAVTAPLLLPYPDRPPVAARSRTATSTAPPTASAATTRPASALTNMDRRRSTRTASSATMDLWPPNGGYSIHS